MATLKVKIFQKGGEKGCNKWILDAARFYASKLLSPRMINLISIRIEMRATKIEKEFHGMVCASYDTGSQRGFTITLQRDISAYSKIETLAHEMVHVRQLASGRLKARYYKTQQQTRRFWGGVDHTDTAYRDRPWEIEAYAMQKALATEFVQQYGPTSNPPSEAASRVIHNALSMFRDTRVATYNAVTWKPVSESPVTPLDAEAKI